MGLGVREGFSEEVADEWSREDEGFTRWKARMVFQGVEWQEQMWGEKKAGLGQIGGPRWMGWKLWERDNGQISQGWGAQMLS